MLSLQTRAVLDIVMKYTKPEVSNRAGRMPNGLGHICGVIFFINPWWKERVVTVVIECLHHLRKEAPLFPLARLFPPGLQQRPWAEGDGAACCILQGVEVKINVLNKRFCKPLPSNELDVLQNFLRTNYSEMFPGSKMFVLVSGFAVQLHCSILCDFIPCANSEVTRCGGGSPWRVVLWDCDQTLHNMGWAVVWTKIWHSLIIWEKAT